MKFTHNITATLYIALSLLGLFLIIALVESSHPTTANLSWRKPAIGTLFSIVCITGILAGVFPSKCSSTIHFGKIQSTTRGAENETVFSGHHPRCGQFKAHIFQVGDKVLCAGCTGLIIGAVLSLFGVVMYFMNQCTLLGGPLVFWVGVIGVCCGLLQYHFFNWGSYFVHLIVNVLFVFGSFLLLISVDAITKSWIIDVYLIVLSVFWVFTRISLSQMDHKRICSACPMEKCKFSKEKDEELYSRRIP